MSKSHYSSKQQHEHVANWQSSGLSRTQYCRQHQLNVTTLCNWIKKWVNKPEDLSSEPYFIPATFVAEENQPITSVISQKRPAVTLNLKCCSITCQLNQLPSIMAELNLC